MDEILDLSAADVFHRRHEHVGAHVITTEKLNHLVTVSVADLDSLPDLLTGDALASLNDDGGSTVRYVRREGGIVRVEFNMSARWAGVRGFFSDEEAAKKFLTTVKKFIKPTKIPDDRIALHFWSWDGDEPGRVIRRIEVPTWEQIRGNYPDAVSTKLRDLMAVKPTDNLSGKLVLWRGAPGTGKTWSLRSLCREWKGWCAAHYIIDTNTFFTNAAYMVGVLMALPNEATVVDDDDFGDFGDEPKTVKKAPHWNLLILEDAGELVGVDSKNRTGQSLSKLLNLSDGLLGQGINLMILITTNEDYEALNSAISRQGRCLSNVSFESFSETEADAWLKRRNCDAPAPRGKRTLADLYAHATERQTIQNVSERNTVGFRAA